MELQGIHHLTAITADAPGNLKFYTDTLGLRLLKKTVNQDDVSAYHLFYGDGEGSPGSDITFFDWPARREQRGTHSICRTNLRVSGRSTLEWWADRFAQAGVKQSDITERDNRLTIDFEDPEGQRLSLIDDKDPGTARPWSKSPVPGQHQIYGLGPIMLSVPVLDVTEELLTAVMNMKKVRQYKHPEYIEDTVYVFEMGAGGVAAELHVAVQPNLPPANLGAGGVHHVAFRSRDADYDDWADRLKSMRIANSGKIDRFYFKSLYFKEPNGILFEIASDGPGFDADEPLESLGERLALPPFLEDRRAEIEANLKPL